MFWQIFQTTFAATFAVVLMGACGYFLVKRKILDEEGLAPLSTLVVRLLLPLFIFYQLQQHFRFETYPHWWWFPLLSVGLSMLGYGMGKMALKLDPMFTARQEFLALTSFQNSGNIPLMIITSLFSGAVMHELYMYVFLYCIGFNILIWTFGVTLLLSSSQSSSVSVSEPPGGDVRIRWQEIANPPVVATIITLIVIALGWQDVIPDIILEPMKILGDCAVPLSMVIMGGNLAAVDLGRLKSKPIVLLVLTKLVVIPLLMIAIVRSVNLSFSLGFLLTLEAAVPSAVSLSLIASYYRTDQRFINQGLFFGHLISVVTVPIFLTFYLSGGQVYG
jgi:predicted permease